jgi:hypothetical protein
MTKSLAGKRFGRLTVVSFHSRAQKAYLWLCRCDCGNEHVVRTDHLNAGRIQSCGCFQAEHRRLGSITHGDTIARKITPEYRSWCGLIERCTNPNNRKYPIYGGRGITVCDEWRNSYAAFLSDMGRKPHSKMSIDRIDVNGNYEPNNCRWATAYQQTHNRRCSRVPHK